MTDNDKWEQVPVALLAQNGQPQGYPQYPPQQYPPPQQYQQFPQQPQVGYQVQVVGGAPTQSLGLQRGDTGFYDRFPRRIQCQFCHYEVITGLAHETGSGTHMIALGFCFIGGLLCVWIPYVMDDFKDTVHVCPNCHQVTGRKLVC